MVTLTKSTDYAPARHPFHARAWKATVDLAIGLSVIFGEATGQRLYSGLADNNPRTLADTLQYWHNYDNATGELVTRTGVSLSKPGDVTMVAGDDTTKIDRYLGSWAGPLSDQTRHDLAVNDLRGLDSLLYLYANDPLRVH